MTIPENPNQPLAEIIKEISEVNDQDSKELAVELLMLSVIPKTGDIEVIDLISRFVDEVKKIREEVEYFDPAIWAGSTAIENIDFLIACGAIDGPIVDLHQDGAALLAGYVARNGQTEMYEKALTTELWEYLPEAKIK